MSYYKKQLPKYCQHKASNRAFIRIGGKMYHLGQYGSPASRREYDRIIAEFVTNGRQPFQQSDELTIDALILRFLDYAEQERNYCDGTKKRIAAIMCWLNRLYGKQSVSQFSPLALKSIRRQMLDNELSLDTVNAYIGVIKQVFYWGCEEEIVPAEVAGALRTVKMLQKGRSAAIEYADIEPVEDAVVEQTLLHIKKQQVKDMIQVQRLAGSETHDVRRAESAGKNNGNYPVNSNIAFSP
jgi:hypothetical protein